MQGYMFIELCRFTNISHGSKVWLLALEQSGLANKEYYAFIDYSKTEFDRITEVLAEITNTPVLELLQSFGEFLAPVIVGPILAFANQVQPNTFSCLEKYEQGLNNIQRPQPHVAANRELMLHCQQISATELLVSVFSPRSLCPIVKGFIKGIAKHCNDPVSIKESHTDSHGSSCCTFSLKKSAVLVNFDLDAIAEASKFRTHLDFKQAQRQGYREPISEQKEANVKIAEKAMSRLRGNKKLNCWEFMKCGRQPGGAHVGDLGVCPVTVDAEHDNTNNGLNAGRFCWRVAGSYCDGEVQGTWAQKILNCASCAFFKKVVEEEGGDLTP